MDKGTRQILALAALAFGIGSLPFNLAVALGWILIAWFLWPSHNVLVPEVIRKNPRLRDLLRRLR